MSIGHHPQEPQYTPDMRKADADISEKERADAQRRIEGSIAPGIEGHTHLGPVSSMKAAMAG
jgi:phosphatidylserine decarboxylase